MKTKITIDSQEIQYFIINERGKIILTGEKLEEKDTFQDTFIDLKTISIGKCLSLTFNRKSFTPINYPTLSIEEC